MFTPQPLDCRQRTRTSLILLAFLGLTLPGCLQAQRTNLPSRTFNLTDTADTAVDIGAVPTSQPLSLTLHLAPPPERIAALDKLLNEQVTASSPNYHKWLTPAEYASSYGATDDQIAATTNWLESQGLTLRAVSAAKTRLTVAGTADQVERAFAVSLRNYHVNGKVHFANSGQPTLPQVIAPLVAGVSGLDDMPAAAPAVLARLAVGQKAISESSDATDMLLSTATAIDANTSPILTLTSTACSSDLAQSDYDAFRAMFRQASAQGITVLASSGCGARSNGSFPASLAEVTAVTTSPTTTPFVAIDPRPAWQNAVGLPNDGSRYEPDLTVSSVGALAQTLSSIIQQTGTRQGNVNAILYSLATTPELYTQPDTAPAGTWEPATGLGLIDLNTLIKVFPRGTTSTTTTLISSTYSVGYGTPIVLTSTVTASSFNVAAPTGTVSFSSAAQGIVGSSPLNGGTATLNLSALPVGAYTLTANYSGDVNYAPSASTSSVVITVSIVNAALTATLSPTTPVPYGSTDTVTATVALPNSSAAPTGTVSATIQGTIGAHFSATLTPNPGGNTATANIVISVPPPGKYTIEVTCAGNANFQCQTPVDLTVTTIPGNTLTSVALSPAAPQAGQPVTITAMINSSGNGSGPYLFSGNITFYDNGTPIATGAVGSNQATTTKTFSGNVQHNIVAKYSGDANWNTSTSVPQSVTPTLLPATLTLTANTYNTIAGANVVFTATAFTTVINTVGPTGTVTFYDTFNGSAVTLGTSAPLTPNGPNQSIAIFSTTGLLAGTHSIYAIYNGDANFSTVTSSPPLAITLGDYNVNMIPQTLTLHPGQTGQVAMLLGFVGGFNGTVSFGCTPPSGSETTCSFNPVTLSGGGSTTMSISTTAAKAKVNQQAKLHGLGTLFAGTSLAMLVCFIAPGRRRSLPTLLVLAFASCLTANLGCGQGMSASADPPTTVADPGTPLGTQIFTITTAGSDGVSTVRHNYQYQVTIQ